MANEIVVHVIDDDAAVRDSIAFLLETADLTVRTHESAVAFLAASDRAPGCIVTDVRMPEMTGIEFLQKLREADDQTPFGFVTTEVSPAMRSLATASGARFLIRLPAAVR